MTTSFPAASSAQSASWRGPEFEEFHKKAALKAISAAFFFPPHAITGLVPVIPIN